MFYNWYSLKIRHYYCGFLGVNSFGLRFLKHSVSYSSTFYVSSVIFPLLISILFLFIPGSVDHSFFVVIDNLFLLIDHSLLKGRGTLSFPAQFPTYCQTYPMHSVNVWLKSWLNTGDKVTPACWSPVYETFCSKLDHEKNLAIIIAYFLGILKFHHKKVDFLPLEIVENNTQIFQCYLYPSSVLPTPRMFNNNKSDSKATTNI